MNKPKTFDEICGDDELCGYCDLNIDLGPGGLCEGRRCDVAYESYLEEFEEEKEDE